MCGKGWPCFLLLLFYFARLLLISCHDCSILDSEDEDNSTGAMHFRGSRPKWPNGVVKYRFHPSLSEPAKLVVRAAFAEYHQKTCIRFQPWHNGTDPNYVSMEQDPDVCGLAHVCMKGGYQYFKIGSYCLNPETAIHELGHTLCLGHEHQRADRDLHVITNPKNRGCTDNTDTESSFKKHTKKYKDRGFYDHGSQMHYACDLCLVPNDTLIRGCGEQVTFGLGVLDVDYINEFYECSGCLRHRWLPNDASSENYTHYPIATVNYYGSGRQVPVIPCRTMLHGELLLGTFDNVSCSVFIRGKEQFLLQNFELLYLPVESQEEFDANPYQWIWIDEHTTIQEFEEIVQFAVPGGSRYDYDINVTYLTPGFVAMGGVSRETLDNAPWHFYMLPTKYGLNLVGSVWQNGSSTNVSFGAGGMELALRGYNVLTCVPGGKSSKNWKHFDECKCSQVHIYKSGCGRAYLEGGCRTCNATYVDLSLTSGEAVRFSEEYSQSVEAIRLRKGCKLRIGGEERFSGNGTVIEQEIVENFTRKIVRYTCQCNDALYQPRVKRTRPIQYPALLDIPSSFSRVLDMLQLPQYKEHVGMAAVNMSRQNLRSHKNAYLLVLDTSGSEHSHVINHLFDASIIPERVEPYNIREFRFPVPIDELGIANSELRIIYAKGFLQNSNDTQTDKLEKFLASHPELAHAIPNAVLIVRDYEDYQLAEDKTKLLETIKSVNLLKSCVTDDLYSNVVFVVPRWKWWSSLSQLNQQNVAQLTQLVETQQFPTPTHVVLAEEELLQPRVSHLINGYAQLPDKQLYPKNLFDKIDQICNSGGDPIGQGVFRAAFRDPDIFNAYQRKVSKPQKSLATNSNPITKVNTSELEDQFELKKLRQRLLRHLPDSLEGNILAGFGYHVLQHRFLPDTPFGYGEPEMSEMGFPIHPFLNCELTNESREYFSVFENQSQCVLSRLKRFGVGGNISLDQFDNAVISEVECNIKNASSEEDGWVLSATQEFRLFKLEVKKRAPLSVEFVNDIYRLEPLFKISVHSARAWLRFFNKYGTHVVQSAYGGGSLKIRWNGTDQQSRWQFMKEPFQEIRHVANFDEISANLSVLEQKAISASQSVKSSGGLFPVNLEEMGVKQGMGQVANWKEFLRFSPVMLTNELELVPLSRVAERLGRFYAEEIDAASRFLFNSDWKGVEVERKVSLPREQTPPMTTQFLDNLG